MKVGRTMIEKLYKFALTDKDLFENVLSEKDFVLNHVIVKEGKVFPKHKTDAEVYIIIIRGKLTIDIGNQGEKRFEAGNVVYIPFGIETVLGNKNPETAEVFVVKLQVEKEE